MLQHNIYLLRFAYLQNLDRCIHFASLIPERSPFYDMIRGYFDLRKIQLKVLQSQFSHFILVKIDEIIQKK